MPICCKWERARAAERGLAGRRIRPGNAEALEFPDGSFDAYTIAFGIRNVPRIEVALAELIACFDREDASSAWNFVRRRAGLDALYDLYSFNVIPALGARSRG